MFDLLSEEDLKKAEILGKALRFGAMLTASENETMGSLKYFPKKKVLELHLVPGTRGLFGEVAEARLNSLAHSGLDRYFRGSAGGVPPATHGCEFLNHLWRHLVQGCTHAERERIGNDIFR